jgi:hypothetical protein
MASSAARSLSTCMATANTPCGCQQTRAYASATAGSAIRPYKIEHEDRPVNAIRKFASARFRRLCSSTQFSSVASPVQQVKSEARTHAQGKRQPAHVCASVCVVLVRGLGQKIVPCQVDGLRLGFAVLRLLVCEPVDGSSQFRLQSMGADKPCRHKVRHSASELDVGEQHMCAARRAALGLQDLKPVDYSLDIFAVHQPLLQRGMPHFTSDGVRAR